MQLFKSSLLLLLLLFTLKQASGLDLNMKKGPPSYTWSQQWKLFWEGRYDGLWAEVDKTRLINSSTDSLPLSWWKKPLLLYQGVNDWMVDGVKSLNSDWFSDAEVETKDRERSSYKTGYRWGHHIEPALFLFLFYGTILYQLSKRLLPRWRRSVPTKEEETSPHSRAATPAHGN